MPSRGRRIGTRRIASSACLPHLAKSLRQRAGAPGANLRRMTTLFDPLQLGDIAIANRLVMAPIAVS